MDPLFHSGYISDPNVHLPNPAEKLRLESMKNQIHSLKIYDLMDGEKVTFMWEFNPNPFF